MKKTFILIYSIISSLIILFAITYFGINIYQEYSHGDLRTQVRFEKMANQIKSTIEKNNLSDVEINRQFENAIGDKKDFTFVKVTLNNKVIYNYPADSADLENYDSKLIVKKEKTVTTSSNKLVISGGLYLLRPVSVYDFSKISFLIILIVAIITIILIIYNNYVDNSKMKYKDAVISYTPKKVQITEEEPLTPDEILENQENIVKEEAITVENEIESKPETIEIKEETPANSEENDTVEKETNASEVAEEKYEQTESLPVQDNIPVEIEQSEEPAGLFSPDTGLGWESYLETRLENELKRATASEIDLSLFIIKFNNLTLKDPVFKEISEYLTVEFQFKDLLFEYKEDSICALRLSMNVDEAFEFAQKILVELSTITAESGANINIGISTRGIRMVSYDRILKEADEAVIHAAEDKDSPVVAFRADAVKYRKFIEEN